MPSAVRPARSCRTLVGPIGGCSSWWTGGSRRMARAARAPGPPAAPARPPATLWASSGGMGAVFRAEAEGLGTYGQAGSRHGLRDCAGKAADDVVVLDGEDAPGFPRGREDRFGVERLQIERVEEPDTDAFLRQRRDGGERGRRAGAERDDADVGAVAEEVEP